MAKDGLSFSVPLMTVMAIVAVLGDVGPRPLVSLAFLICITTLKNTCKDIYVLKSLILSLLYKQEHVYDSLL